MNKLKELIKEVENDFVIIESDDTTTAITLAKIRLEVRKQTVEAVDEDMECLSPETHKDWQKLKELLEVNKEQ